MKIALLQCNSVSGDVVGNMERILQATRQAATDGAELCITPELALCGVAPRAYLLAPDFTAGCLKALDALATAFRKGPALLVGTPVPSVYAPGLLSNAAVFLQHGQWKVVSHKIYHDQEQRTSAFESHDEDSRYFDRGISCGLITHLGWRLGVVLCENALDGGSSFWQVSSGNSRSTLLELLRRGVDAIIHMAASPFCQGIQEEREYLLSHMAARHHVHIISANMVGGNDCYVYHGQSCVFAPTGRILARGKAFAEDILVVDTARRHNSTQRTESQPASPEEACWHALVLGTRDFVHKCGMRSAFVALSGGMDSALVACVAVAALGSENVTGVRLPSPYNSPGSLEDAATLAANLNITTLTLPIASLMEAYAATLASTLHSLSGRPDDVTLENIQARIRGTLVAALANRARALILSTGNKSETAMGYCTLYGDTVGALAVIGDLTKTQVYAVGRWYNTQTGHIPEAILTKAPSAELRPGQKDTDSLPPYDILDPVLENLLRFPTTNAEPNAHLGNLTCAPPPDAQHREIRNRMFRAEFKRRQMPPALCVSRVPFSVVWRTPIAGAYRLPVPPDTLNIETPENPTIENTP